MPYKAVLTTERGLRHQRAAQAAAPGLLEVTTLRAPDREILRRHLADAVYWISERVGTVDADLIEAAQHPQLIQRLGSLWYDIDLQAAQRAGVAVCYWPVLGVIRVAEHVVLQMLALAKRLREAEAIALVASPCWAESRRTTEYLCLQLVRTGGDRRTMAGAERYPLPQDESRRRVGRLWQRQRGGGPIP